MGLKHYILLIHSGAGVQYRKKGLHKTTFISCYNDLLVHKNLLHNSPYYILKNGQFIGVIVIEVSFCNMEIIGQFGKRGLLITKMTKPLDSSLNDLLFACFHLNVLLFDFFN